LILFEEVLSSNNSENDIFNEEFIRKLEYWSLIFRRIYSGELSASRRSKEVGAGIEFSDRREYFLGDDFRYIDWKAFGRTEKALLRLFVEEKDLQVNILLDSSASMGVGEPPKIESAKKLAAAISYMVLFNLDRVGVTIFSENVTHFLPPARGKGRMIRIFEMLRNVSAGGKTDLMKLAEKMTSSIKGGGLSMVISDLMVGSGFDECLSRLMYYGSEVSVIRVVAPEDKNPVFLGDLRLIDSETGETQNITVTPGMISRYKEAFDKMSEVLESTALKRGARFVTVSSSLTFDEQVSIVLRAMAKRK